jgi:nitrate/nitrite transporter NarK
MREAAGNLGTKAVALAVLLVAAWILFKFVLGFVTMVAWIAVAVLAVIAVIWSLNRLL